MNSERLGAGVRCYVAKYEDKPVAFIAVAHVHMLVRYFRVSRLVVLPDYQGVGVGTVSYTHLTLPTILLV